MPMDLVGRLKTHSRLRLLFFKRQLEIFRRRKHSLNFHIAMPGDPPTLFPLSRCGLACWNHQLRSSPTRFFYPPSSHRPLSFYNNSFLVILNAFFHIIPMPFGFSQRIHCYLVVNR